MTVLPFHRRPASVLADPIPDVIYVHRGTGTIHAPSRCRLGLPMSRLSTKRGADGWRYAKRWCKRCWSGRRCTRWVVDSLGVNRTRCGQPAGLGGDECRWHHELDITVDKRIERAA